MRTVLGFFNTGFKEKTYKPSQFQNGSESDEVKLANSMQGLELKWR